ncbi:MAG: FAD:protein FMN transferase [Eubacterium sp.]|nr:FAD:protein FMN transferase [Eubacterium sp.]
MKKFLSILISAMLILTLCSCSIAGKQRFEKTFIDLFDTASTLIAYDESQSAFDEKYGLFYDELKEYDKLYDIYNEYEGVNNLCTVNRLAAKEPVKVDEKIIDLLEYGKEVYKFSGGAVNICFGSVLSLWHDARENGLTSPESAALPDMLALENASKHTDINSLVIDRENCTVFFSDSEMSLDVGAIAKGYAGQKICEYAKNELWQDFALSLGGNVITSGFKGDGKTKWSIGIENPDTSSQQALLNVEISDLCVVTSGDYQRYFTVDGKNYCHIINKDTLMPSEYFSGVTVICKDSALADALSTTLFNMSYDDGLALVEGMEGVEAVWVDKDYNKSFSSGFENYIK